MADPTTPPADDDRLVIRGNAEVKRITGFSEKTLKRLADKGEPVGRIRIGNGVGYHRPTLDRWLAARAAGTSNVPAT